MKILKSIRKHYYEKALKAYSDYISEILKTKSGSELKDLVEKYHANSFSLSHYRLDDILSDMEDKYHTISTYFGHHNYELTPDITEFSFDDIKYCDWLCVNKTLHSDFKEQYKIPFLTNKFGFGIYSYAFGYSYLKSAWYRFIYSLYIKEYNIKFSSVSYISVENEHGEEFKINTILPLLELDLIKNGYTLLREDNENLIYIQK